jgi:hypothetical protein
LKSHESRKNAGIILRMAASVGTSAVTARSAADSPTKIRLVGEKGRISERKIVFCGRLLGMTADPKVSPGIL